MESNGNKISQWINITKICSECIQEGKVQIFFMCKNFHFYTCLEKDSGNCSATQWTWSAGWIVFGKHPQARFTKDMVAWITHVRVEINIQAHSTEIAFFISSEFMLIICMQVIICRLQEEKENIFSHSAHNYFG